MKTRRSLLILFVLPLIQSACAPARTPAPSAGAVLPSPDLTNTPPPTLTPTRTPTLIPTATNTPAPTNTPTPLPKLDFETNLTLQQVFEFFYQIGDFELLTSLLNELAGYYDSPAVIGQIFSLEGDAFASQGDYQAAAEAYIQALQAFPAVQQVNLDVCRVYGLLEQAEQALPYCEKATKANPSFWTYLYRGKVYALLGRLDDARADFEKVAAQLQTLSGSEEKKLVQELASWIEALQSGKNPITPELLLEERQREAASALPTQTITEKAPPSARTLQEAAASYGFGPFAEVNIRDPFQDIALPFAGSTMKMGTCAVDLALQADEKMIYKVMMTMKGCSDLEEYFMGLRLVEEFFPDKTEKAGAVVWMFKEANSVIELQKREAKSINVRKCNLYATYQRTDQSTQWFFSCH